MIFDKKAEDILFRNQLNSTFLDSITGNTGMNMINRIVNNTLQLQWLHLIYQTIHSFFNFFPVSEIHKSLSGFFEHFLAQGSTSY